MTRRPRRPPAPFPDDPHLSPAGPRPSGQVTVGPGRSRASKRVWPWWLLACVLASLVMLGLRVLAGNGAVYHCEVVGDRWGNCWADYRPLAMAFIGGPFVVMTAALMWDVLRSPRR